jgi:hypothetical protein
VNVECFTCSNSSLQSTITAIIPAKIPAAIPSARIAIGTAAAELGATVADAVVEAEITVEVELVTALIVLGVVDEVDEVDADVDVSVGVVIETLTGIEVDDIEIGIKLELADVKSVLVLSVAVSDGVLKLKNPSKFMVRMKYLEMLTLLRVWKSLSWL